MRHSSLGSTFKILSCSSRVMPRFGFELTAGHALGARIGQGSQPDLTAKLCRYRRNRLSYMPPARMTAKMSSLVVCERRLSRMRSSAFDFTALALRVRLDSARPIPAASLITSLQLRVISLGLCAARYVRPNARFSIGVFRASFFATHRRSASLRSLVRRLSCLPVSSSSTYQVEPRTNKRYRFFMLTRVKDSRLRGRQSWRKCHHLLTVGPKNKHFP